MPWLKPVDHCWNVLVERQTSPLRTLGGHPNGDTAQAEEKGITDTIQVWDLANISGLLPRVWSMRRSLKEDFPLIITFFHSRVFKSSKTDIWRKSHCFCRLPETVEEWLARTGIQVPVLCKCSCMYSLEGRAETWARTWRGVKKVVWGRWDLRQYWPCLLFLAYTLQVMGRA